jgi:ribosomal protein L11 methyltransferase
MTSPPHSWPALDVVVRAAPGRNASALDQIDASEALLLALDGLDATALDRDDSNSRYRVYFNDVAARDAAALALRADGSAPFDVIETDVEDEGWVLKVQQDLRAVRIGDVVVAPPWDVPRAGSGTTVIVIEPSTGFGTGHHQSTRLCLGALQRLDLADADVIDIGTGSGVLAIAAALRGASRVLALDNDVDSIAAAHENIARNRVGDRVTADTIDVDTATAIAPAEIVVANLTAWLLRRHAASIARLLSPGGRLVTSGFTHDQVPLVTDAFSGFTVETTTEEDDWVCVTFLARTEGAPTLPQPDGGPTP